MARSSVRDPVSVRDPTMRLRDPKMRVRDPTMSVRDAMERRRPLAGLGGRGGGSAD